MIVSFPRSALGGHCLQVREAASTAVVCDAQGRWCHPARVKP
jgi:hypothetical protein